MKIIIKPIYWCKCGKDKYPHRNMRKKELHGPSNRIYRYDIHIKSFCCNKMGEILNESYIHNAIEWSDEDKSLVIKDIAVDCCGVYETNIPIKCCPFCGERINIEVMKDDRLV